MRTRLITVAILCSAVITTVVSAFVQPTAHSILIYKGRILKLTELPKEDDNLVHDTLRVRIWRALACGEELSLSQLSSIVKERRVGELRSHLTHVQRQCKTLSNKSNEWRIRRGLMPLSNNDRQEKKLRIKMRRGKKNELYVRLG